jgi:hypothetical protein
LEHVNENTLLRISNGQTGPELGAKPSSGSTLDANIRLRPYGRGAVEIGTAQPSATVRVVSDMTNADLELEPQGTGEVKVRGSRVLTTEDALNAAGGGIDQAAVEAAVAAATAPLLARIEALEAKTAAIEGDGTINAEYVIADIVGGAPNMSVDRLVQFLIDAIVWGADGVQGASDNSYNDVFERLKSLRTRIADAQQTVDAIAAQQVTEHDWLVASIQNVEADYNGKFDSTDQTLGQLLQNQDTLLQNDADIVQYILDESATKAELAQLGQDIEQAVGNVLAEITRIDGLFLKFGAGTTAAESLDDFFNTLNSIVGQLIDATGITPASRLGE